MGYERNMEERSFLPAQAILDLLASGQQPTVADTGARLADKPRLDLYVELHTDT